MVSTISYQQPTDSSLYLPSPTLRTTAGSHGARCRIAICLSALVALVALYSWTDVGRALLDPGLAWVPPRWRLVDGRKEAYGAQAPPTASAAGQDGKEVPKEKARLDSKTLVFPPNFRHSQKGNSVPSYLFNTLMKRANVMGTFVEFGCADGTTNSNTFAFEQMGWKGLCIEPNYHNFLKAKKARTNAIFALVTGKPGNFTYAQVSGKANQLSGVVEFYSPQYKRLISNEKKSGHVEYVRLPGTPLETLLTSYGFTHVDWISVDCEGCEAAFITNFDFTKWGVQIVNYEPNTAAVMHTAEIEAAFKSHGFVFDRALQDRIWRKPGPFSPKAF